MNRFHKQALLTKILQGKARKADVEQLRQSNGAGGVVILYEKGEPQPGPEDEVNFSFNGQVVTMPLRDIQAYTRYNPLTLCFLPDKKRRMGKQ